MKTLVITFIFSLTCVNILYSQACCSAGSPMLGALETSTTLHKNLQLNLTYDYNNLNSVFEGSTQIDDQTRERVTNSVLLESSYGLTDRITLTGLFSFINQQRIITTATGTENSVSSSGFGDALLLIKYELLSQTFVSQQQLAVGIGTKIPIGESDLTQNGILLPADMQPGSGSWDFVFWSFYSLGFMPDLPLTIFATASYKLNTSSQRFTISDAGYKFGNEFLSSVGAGYRTDSIFDYSLAFQLRTTAADQFDSESVPNTGGVWLYAVPGLNIKLTENLITSLAGQIPLYRNLGGIQLTTTYTLSASIFYSHLF